MSAYKFKVVVAAFLVFTPASFYSDYSYVSFLGSTVRLTCEYGDGVINHLYWQKWNGTGWSNVLRYFNGKWYNGNGYSSEKVSHGKDNSTLILYNASVRDEGRYKCYVAIDDALPVKPITDLRLFGNTTASITQCNQDSTCNVTIAKNVATDLTCRLSSVYPNKNITIGWHMDRNNGSDSDNLNSTTNTHENEDGSYNFESIISISLAIENDPRVYVCRAAYPSPNGTKNMDLVVSVVSLDDIEIGLDKKTIGLITFFIVFAIAVLIILLWCFITRHRRNNQEERQEPSIQEDGNPRDSEDDVGIENGRNTGANGAAAIPLLRKDDQGERQEPPIQENGNPRVPEDQTEIKNDRNTRANGASGSETYNVILTDELLIIISKAINLVSIEDLAVHFGLTYQEGRNTFDQMGGDVERAYLKILHKYINMHGRGKDVALNLRNIFIKNSMVPVAETLDEELRKRNIELETE